MATLTPLDNYDPASDNAAASGNLTPLPSDYHPDNESADTSFGMPIYKSNLPSYTRGQLPSRDMSGEVSPEKPITGQDMANAAAFIPAGAAEVGAANVMGRVLSPFAKQVGEESVLPLAARAVKGATTGAAANATYNASSGRDVEAGAELGAGLGAVAPIASKYLFPREIPESTVIKQTQDAKNNNYAAGVSSTIGDMTTTKNGLYSMANEVGDSEKYDASSLQNILNNLHTKYTTDSLYDNTPLVRRLDSWKSLFEKDGSITPTRLNKLQDQIDDAYRENPKSPEGDVYQSISGPVSDHLEAAKTQFPNWGKLIDTADDANYHLMKYTRDDDSFTDKWSPDSNRDYNSTMSRNGNVADTMGSTKKQINNITNIQNEEQLQKVMAFMPPEMQSKFLQDVANNSSSPLGIKNIVKGILQTAKGDPYGGVVNIAKGIPNKSDIANWDADAATHMSDRIQQWKDAGNEAYQAHLQNQLQKQGYSATAARQYATQPRALPAPNAPKLLAGPQGNDFISNGIGETSLVPRSELAASRAVEPNAGVTLGDDRGIPDPRAAKRQIDFRSQKVLNPENSQIPLSQVARNPKAAGIEPLEIDPVEDEYDEYNNRHGLKRGGAVNTEPTEKMKAAGNYKKSHLRIHGLDISIENPKGSIRTGTSKDGKEWKSPPMAASYGYIKQTLGADGDHVDCFIGDDAKSKRVYVIDQKNDDGKFDEHKVIFNAADRDEAVRLYKGSFSDKKNRIMKVTRLTIPEFKTWLKNGNTKQPMRKAA